MKRKLSQNKIIALIPARQGSKRIKNKNIAKISNHPLIAYTINAAKKTNLFSNISDFYYNFWICNLKLQSLPKLLVILTNTITFF